ncbi:hypothetical protein EBS40_07440 [bacterium]|nr:hypothetical protein [bacterium]
MPSGLVIRDIARSVGIDHLSMASVHALQEVYLTILASIIKHLKRGSIQYALHKMGLNQKTLNSKNVTEACTRFDKHPRDYPSLADYQAAKRDYYRQLKNCLFIPQRSFKSILGDVAGKTVVSTSNVPQLHVLSESIFTDYLGLLVHVVITPTSIHETLKKFIKKPVWFKRSLRHNNLLHNPYNNLLHNPLK